METLQAGRSDPWYMLDNAQACVQALEPSRRRRVPTVAPLEPAAFAQDRADRRRCRRPRDAAMEAAARRTATVPPVAATEARRGRRATPTRSW